MPIEDYDVCRIEDTKETNTIDSLLCQYQVEVFASRFALCQHRPHRERGDAHWVIVVHPASIPITEVRSNTPDKTLTEESSDPEEVSQSQIPRGLEHEGTQKQSINERGDRCQSERVDQQRFA